MAHSKPDSFSEVGDSLPSNLAEFSMASQIAPHSGLDTSGDGIPDVRESVTSGALTRVAYLMLIGDHVFSRNSLYNLCLVNKGFNAVFTRFLYSHVRLRGTDSMPIEETVDHLIESKTLGSTTVLELKDFLNPKLREQSDGRTNDWAAFQKQVIRLISHTPSLRKFVWDNTHISHMTLQEIRDRCPHIRHVSAGAPHSMLEDIQLSAESNEAAYIRKWGILCRLSNLTSLTVYQFRGKPHIWRTRIVGILLKSRGVVELGLSVHPHDVIDHHVTSTGCVAVGTACTTPQSYANFFPKLCEVYTNTGGSQLKLKSLKLGTSMLLIKGLIATRGILSSLLHPEIKQEGLEILSKFTDLTELKDLSIFNRGIAGTVHGNAHKVMVGHPSVSQVAWLVSNLPRICPNLEILSLLLLDNRTATVLCNLNEGYMSKLGLRIETFNRAPGGGPGTWRRPLFDLFNPLPVSISPHALWLPRIGEVERAHIIHAMRMPSVRTLSLEMPYYYFDTRFLNGIKWMSNLKHLWLRCCMCVQEQCSDADAVEAKKQSDRAARGRGVRVHSEHLKDHADPLKLAEVCRGLRYLRICDVAYLVIRHESTDSITLVALDEWEDQVEAPDFFKYRPPPTIPSISTPEHCQYV